MNEARIVEAEHLFLALADRTRLKLLEHMKGEEVNVNTLTEFLSLSQPKISRHLAYLRKNGLVNTRRVGKWVYYSISWPEDEGLKMCLEYALTAVGREERNTYADGHMYLTEDQNLSQPDELDTFLL